MANYYNEIKYETVVLERIRIGLRKLLDNEIIDCDIQTHQEHFIHAIAFEIRGYIWAEPLDKYECEYPADWWQSFKERWFPQLLLNRYPIKYKHFKIETKMLYPNYRPAIPNELYHLHINKYEFVD